tara:strand:+ start:661 stop:1302 length:642 start_codon:yes stop_codon:yes gene_type:complete
MSDSVNEVAVNFSQQFSNLPSIKITTNKPINVYLTDVTKSSFKINKSQDDNLIVHYIAIEGDEDDLPANEETIVVSIQPDPLDSSIDRFYFDGSYPLTLNAVIGKLYKFDISGIDSQHDLQFGFGQGDGHWDPNYKIMGSSSADQFAQGLENSFIDYKTSNQNLVQLRLESPAENGVTITRDINGQNETVNYFHFWNMFNPDYGGQSTINFGS